jgi:hypothetical protein
MKILAIFLFVLTLTTPPVFAASKDPIVIEVLTAHKTVEDALQACKTILLTEKFIAQEIQKKGFTATRTTGSKADYFVADVAAADVDGKIKITVTFVKVGTGLLNLKKVAERVKVKLE